MGVNLRVAKKTGILLKFSYTLNKLKNGVEKHYCLRKKCQHEFFDMAEAGIDKKKGRENFFNDLMQNKALINFGNIKSSLLRAIKAKNR